MKRVGYLYSKIYDMDNLRLAYQKAKKGKGWYAEIQEIDKDPEKYLKELQQMLMTHTYRTSEYEVYTRVENGKKRKIYKLPFFPDRIAQWAIMLVIEPYLMRTFTDDTYSALPGRGIHKALNKLKKATKQYEYCLKLDIKHYYQSIDHEILMDMFRRIFKDPELLWILEEIIESVCTADEDDFIEQRRTGVPIGNYISQYCGNLYLSNFDHWIKEKKAVKEFYRYMDDIVILGNDIAKLHTLMDDINKYMKHLLLRIKGNWQIFPIKKRGIDYVGYRVFCGYCLLRKSTCKRFKEKMKTIYRKCLSARMEFSDFCTVASYGGWLKHCDSYRLSRKYLFPLKSYRDTYYYEIIERRKNEGIRFNKKYCKTA